MPNKKVLEEKQIIVDALVEKMKNASAGVLVDYKGITVANDTKLRRELRSAGVEYNVIKNTMLHLATERLGYQALDSHLNGTTALAISPTDPVAAAKVLTKYAKKNENFKIKAGFVEGKVINREEVSSLAELPPREVLIAKVLGGFNAPLSGLVNVLNGNLRGLVVALNAIAEKKSQDTVSA